MPAKSVPLRPLTLLTWGVLLVLAAAVAWVFHPGSAQVRRLLGRAPAASAPPAAAAASAPAAGPGIPAAAGAAPASAPAPALSTVKVTVGRNDTLDRIFRRLAISLADLASLRSLPGLKAHLDRLHPGESLTLVFSRAGALMGLERRLNVQQTLKVTKADTGFAASVLQNPLATRTRIISGRIDSSLFESMAAAGGHDQTALALANIFAWDIDFVLDIQPGDTFTVAYIEILEDGKYLQDGPVLAARFVNAGRTYEAVRYERPDGTADFYTPDGRSVHKAFLRAPLDFTRVSSPFDLHRRHPILNTIRAHKGVDYAAPIGTPVKAAGDGRVLFAGRRGGYGNLVELAHSAGITTVYGHLSRFAHGLHAGKHVSQGEIIAYVGMTGLATGPHLHYEYRVNGVFKNPQTVTLPRAQPIEAQLRGDFLAKTAPLLASLDPAPVRAGTAVAAAAHAGPGLPPAPGSAGTPSAPGPVRAAGTGTRTAGTAPATPAARAAANAAGRPGSSASRPGS